MTILRAHDKSTVAAEEKAGHGGHAHAAPPHAHGHGHGDAEASKHTQSEIAKVLATAPGAAAMGVSGDFKDKDHPQRTKHNDVNLANHGKGHGHVAVVDELAVEKAKKNAGPRGHGHNKYKTNKQSGHEGFGHAKHYDFE